MTLRLLDTNIVSYIHKRHPLFARYRHHLDGYDHAISFQTLAELQVGGLNAGWNWLRWQELNETMSTITVIHSDYEIAFRWAEIKNIRKYRPIGDADCWIAATAFSFGLDLVTHNPSDFTGIPGLTIITEVP